MTSLNETMELFRETALYKDYMSRKKRVDDGSKYCLDRKFSEGNKVMVLIQESPRGLSCSWEGPLIIDRQLGPYRYLVKDPDTQWTRELHINEI